jgi:hypothetical protein
MFKAKETQTRLDKQRVKSHPWRQHDKDNDELDTLDEGRTVSEMAFAFFGMSSVFALNNDDE